MIEENRTEREKNIQNRLTLYKLKHLRSLQHYHLDQDHNDLENTTMDRLAFEDSFRIRAYKFRPINSCHNTSVSTMRRALSLLMVADGSEDRYAVFNNHHEEEERERKRFFGLRKWKKLQDFDLQSSHKIYLNFHSSSTKLYKYWSWCDKSFSIERELQIKNSDERQ